MQIALNICYLQFYLQLQFNYYDPFLFYEIILLPFHNCSAATNELPDDTGHIKISTWQVYRHPVDILHSSIPTYQPRNKRFRNLAGNVINKPAGHMSSLHFNLCQNQILEFFIESVHFQPTRSQYAHLNKLLFKLIHLQIYFIFDLDNHLPFQYKPEPFPGKIRCCCC